MTEPSSTTPGKNLSGNDSSTPLLPSASQPTPAGVDANCKLAVRGLSFFYGAKQALKEISLLIPQNAVTALIGPSGCGKTTLLRCLNRMHDLYAGNRYIGEILMYPEGINIIGRDVDPMEMRLRVGMVFQKPNPFPKSIFENVAFGLRLAGLRSAAEIEER
ncbi:MAG: phosphate ABC transporter ATP-binding protein, partial [Planctomycetaceae bacterium]